MNTCRERTSEEKSRVEIFENSEDFQEINHDSYLTRDWDLENASSWLSAKYARWNSNSKSASSWVSEKRIFYQFLTCLIELKDSVLQKTRSLFLIFLNFDFETFFKLLFLKSKNCSCDFEVFISRVFMTATFVDVVFFSWRLLFWWIHFCFNFDVTNTWRIFLFVHLATSFKVSFSSCKETSTYST